MPDCIVCLQPDHPTMLPLLCGRLQSASNWLCPACALCLASQSNRCLICRQAVEWVTKPSEGAGIQWRQPPLDIAIGLGLIILIQTIYWGVIGFSYLPINLQSVTMITVCLLGMFLAPTPPREVLAIRHRT